MAKEMEELLKDYKTNIYNDISIPNNIDIFIEKGIQEKNTYEKTKRRKKITTIAACFMMILFLTAIRVSPVFAAYISNIPGLDYIVKLINHDKGLQIALKNNFIQPIGISDTNEDITLTVDNIIVDESRMVIFYTVENKGDHSYLRLTDVRLKDEKGEELPASFSYGGFTEINFNEERKNSGQVDISFQAEDYLSDTITLEANFSEAKQSWEVYNLEQSNNGSNSIDDKDRFIKLASTWRIDIPIDKEKFENLKEIYSVDKTISVYNQKIDINQLVIHPTRMELDVAYDENNTFKIFSIANLRITDEKGEWKTIVNGVTSSNLDENTIKYYFQSGYFTYPKELYVEGEGIYALEKDKMEVLVDLKKEEILKSPNNEIELQEVALEGDYYVLNFKVPQYKDNIMYDMFDKTFKDSKGKKFKSNRTGFSTYGEDMGYSELYYYIPNDIDMDNIITIEVVHYPNLIGEPFKVKIK